MANTVCILNLEWTFFKVKIWLVLSHFWPLLKWVTFLGADHSLPKICSSLKPNHYFARLVLSETMTHMIAKMLSLGGGAIKVKGKLFPPKKNLFSRSKRRRTETGNDVKLDRKSEYRCLEERPHWSCDAPPQGCHL